MITVLLVIHAFITSAMIGLILLQKSDGAGPLGVGGGGTNSLFTARGVANLLTRTTSVLATLFIGNCILIGVLINNQNDVILPDKVQTTESDNSSSRSPQDGIVSGAQNSGETSSPSDANIPGNSDNVSDANASGANTLDGTVRPAETEHSASPPPVVGSSEEPNPLDVPMSPDGSSSQDGYVGKTVEPDADSFHQTSQPVEPLDRR